MLGRIQVSSKLKKYQELIYCVNNVTRLFMQKDRKESLMKDISSKCCIFKDRKKGNEVK